MNIEIAIPEVCVTGMFSAVNLSGSDSPLLAAKSNKKRQEEYPAACSGDFYLAAELDLVRAELEAGQMLLIEKDEAILEQALNRIGPQMIPEIGTIGD